MKLGMNMLLWSTDVRGPEYDDVFAMLKDAGFGGVEIPIFDREVDSYAELGAKLDALGLERLAGSARGPDEDPIAADPAAAVAATKANLDSAGALGAPLICGPLGAPLRRLDRDRGVRRRPARARERDEDLAPVVRERGAAGARRRCVPSALGPGVWSPQPRDVAQSKRRRKSPGRFSSASRRVFACTTAAYDSSKASASGRLSNRWRRSQASWAPVQALAS